MARTANAPDWAVVRFVLCTAAAWLVARRARARGAPEGTGALALLTRLLQRAVPIVPALELLRVLPFSVAATQIMQVTAALVKHSVLGHRPVHPVDAESVVASRVWPGDLDLFGHMNNKIYNERMEWGRFGFESAACLMTWMRRQRMGAPGLYTTTVKFRRELKLLQAFTVRTRLLGWGERTFYYEHLFEVRKGGNVSVYAHGLSLMRIPRRSQHRCVDVLVAMERAGYHRRAQADAVPLCPERDAVRLPQELLDLDAWYSDRTKYCEENA